MEINNKTDHLSRIRVSFIMLLLAVCLTMNAFFGSTYSFYELSDNIMVMETQVISESIAANADGDHTTCLPASFSNRNDSHNSTVTKNTCSLLMIAAIPNGISLLFFLTIFFLFCFSILFILLPDRWTLISLKVRLDN